MFNPTDAEKLKLLDDTILMLIERLYQMHESYMSWQQEIMREQPEVIMIEKVLRNIGILDDEGCINVTWLDTEINKICEVYT